MTHGTMREIHTTHSTMREIHMTWHDRDPHDDTQLTGDFQQLDGPSVSGIYLAILFQGILMTFRILKGVYVQKLMKIQCLYV